MDKKPIVPVENQGPLGAGTDNYKLLRALQEQATTQYQQLKETKADLQQAQEECANLLNENIALRHALTVLKDVVSKTSPLLHELTTAGTSNKQKSAAKSIKNAEIALLAIEAELEQIKERA